MTAPVTLRTEAGDEVLDLPDFESRVRQGEVSPQSLVCLPAVTGGRFVPACDLQLYRQLQNSRRAHFRRTFTVANFPYLTSAFILLQLGVYLATVRTGELSLDEMVEYGAKVGPLVADLGETWRLFTANFLHKDPLHIGLNLFVLFNVGGVLENTWRRLDYLGLLVTTGLATMATSLALNDAITIGASGMVFGCLGGVVAFGLRHRSLLPSHYRSIISDAAIPTVLGLLFIGLTSQGVDNWAHVGGLVAGLLGGFFIRPRLLAEPEQPWEPGVRALPWVVPLLVVLGAQPWLSARLPRLQVERDEAFGVSVPVPLGWMRGRTPLGAEAWSNGIAGLGRATFAAEAVEMREGADAMAQARRFVDDRLDPRALPPEIHGGKAEAPQAARLGERPVVRVRALLEETSQRTRVVAWFVPRGTLVYQLVFTWPEAFPAYGRVADQMLAGVRFGEAAALRQARAQAALFPGSVPVHARLGELLLEAGEPLAAMAALQVAVTGLPSRASYRVALSRAALAAGDVAQACAAAQAALAFDPHDAPALEASARCALAQGRPRDALTQLRAALEATPGDPRLEAARARLEAELPPTP